MEAHFFIARCNTMHHIGLVMTTKHKNGRRDSAARYRRVDTTTLAGVRTAERLHNSGWKIAASSFWAIDFYRPKSQAGNICGELLFVLLLFACGALLLAL